MAIKSNYLLISGVPYVNSKKEILYGTLVSILNLSGNKTVRPKMHVVHFAGEHPCHTNGAIIEQIRHGSGRKQLTRDIATDHSFSNKPPNGYEDYYEKMTRYITILENEAKAIDDTVTARTGRIPVSDEEDPIFHYPDTNSSRSEIMKVSEKLRGQKVAIIGVGGTGSYVLDLVAKTPVAEIHLFDRDSFLVHNAFRAPGAPTREELNQLIPKVKYLSKVYSRMHKYITPHEEHMNADNISLLANMTFVFICMDKGAMKAEIMKFLESHNISFVDVGIGVIHIEEDHSLIGQVRTTASTPEMRDHIWDKGLISHSDDERNDEYSTNIQIAELNALNAAQAVIKWKKIIGFYQDLVREHHTVYSINDNATSHENEI